MPVCPSDSIGSNARTALACRQTRNTGRVEAVERCTHDRNGLRNGARQGWRADLAEMVADRGQMDLVLHPRAVRRRAPAWACGFAATRRAQRVAPILLRATAGVLRVCRPYGHVADLDDEPCSGAASGGAGKI